MRNYIAMTICLLFWWTLQARGQEPHEFGTLSVGSIKSCQYTPSENDYGQWFCFTLAEPADVYLTLKRLNAMDSMIQMYDNEENGITVNEVESASDQVKAYVNLPAGNYQIFVDYTEQNYTELYIEASRPDMEAFETNLGTFDASFSETLERNMEDTYAFFHGAGYDGYSCHRLELGKSMDFDVNLAGSTVKSSNIKLLNAQHTEVSSSENMNGLCSLHVANLAKGIYHVLVKSYDDSGTLAFCVSGHAETGIEDKSDGTNHIVERTYTNASGDSWNDKVTYFDEMGREQEVVEKGASPDASSDYVTLTEYDMFGHVSKKWLPAVMSGNQGKYIAPTDLKPGIVTSHQGDSKPYALTEYEPSPANRVTAEYGAGAAWQDKGKAQRKDYLLNNTKYSELNCMRYSVSGNMGGMKVDCKGSYADGNLTVTVLTDEDGRKSYEFKDGWGNTVLQRKEVDGVFVDTYFIYDAWGNLMATLPPMASNEMCVTGKSWSEKDDLLASYAYLYAYDGQKRQMGSKLPGCDWSYVIYDRADTPILTQDGEQRQRGEWSFTIPDVWGRPCLGGVCKNNVTVGTELSNVSATYSGSSSNYGYTVTGLALTSPTYHKITYYDSYDFLANSSLGMSSLAFDSSRGSDFNTLEKSCAKGKMTGCISAMDGQISNSQKSAYYYDYRGRTIQEVSTNHLGGLDKTLKAYDFTDNCVRELGIHSAKGKSTYTTDVRYTYDHMGRLLTTTHAINKNAAVTISNLEYDKLGKMVAEKRNGNGKLKSTYTYNIRDWQKNISGTLFSEQLFYQESHLGNTPQYGGNVSAMDWKTGDMIKTRGYVFGYDSMSRLKSASYSEDGTSNGHYSTSYTYDLQGNMETLTRKGMLDDKTYGLIDNLTYGYNGNQVVKITDKVQGPYYKDVMHFVDGANAATEYKYNKNGCMTQDLNKNILEIDYNLLNLPTKVTFSDGSVIAYGYDADGARLSADYNLSLMNVMKGNNGATQAGGTVKHHRDYCGNYIYEDGALKMLLFDGGYVSFDANNNPKYHFYLKDHLGNNRVVADANGNIEQVNHYYPFGGLMAESKGDVQPYKYNGKELDRMHGLDWHDYGARQLVDGRFTSPDPHATKYPGTTPYAYCENNPIRLIDEDGKDPGDFFKTMDEAALDFALNYNVISIQNNVEYSTAIICINDEKGNIGYTYSIPIVGTEDRNEPQLYFRGHRVAATAHTHGAYTKDEQNINLSDNFSGKVDYKKRTNKYFLREDKELKDVPYKKNEPTDIGLSNFTGIIVYVATPNGSLQKYNPKDGNRTQMSTKIPSDKNDPHRLNNISIYPFGKCMDSFKNFNNFFRLMSNPIKMKRK